MPKSNKPKSGMGAGTVSSERIKKLLGRRFMPPGRLGPSKGLPPTGGTMMDGYKKGGVKNLKKTNSSTISGL